MSTRSNIGIVNADNSISGIYCHYDGYLSNNGNILLEHYRSVDIVQQLMTLGDLSSLGEKLYPNVYKPHTFNNKQDDVCVSYRRDRGETEVNCTIFTDIGEFENMANDTGAEYQYLFKNDRWSFRADDGKWQELTAECCIRNDVFLKKVVDLVN